MVLLQKITDASIVENLKKRFTDDCIYVSFFDILRSIERCMILFCIYSKQYMYLLKTLSVKVKLSLTQHKKY